MRPAEFLQEISRRDRLLAHTGWVNLLLFLGMLCWAPFDSRTVMGLNPWIKPMKFALSITIYVWTIAWFLKYVHGAAGTKRVISRGAALAMLVEIICIITQAARGTTSHYNNTTAVNSAVFALMGIMILFNTAMAASVLALFLTQKTGLPSAYLWGIRLGILVLVIGSLEGGVMIFNAAHTVGLPDGGPGLPFLNWSTRAGDLRVAHLLGLHALQIFPGGGYLLTQWQARGSLRHPLPYLLAFAGIYLAVAVFTFGQAMQGRPLLTW